MKPIFKILTPDEWETFQTEDHFKGSSMDQNDGFIHASLPDQYQRIVDKFFNNSRPLILLEIDTTLLKPGTLRVEANKPGGDEYPHIYGDIPLKAVISHKIIE